MLNVNISVTGLQELQRTLGNIQGIANDFSPETKEIADYLLKFYSNDVYDSQGGVYGSAWAPLSEPYATRKAKEFGGGQILVASGKMKQGYTMYTSSDYALIKNEATNKGGAFYAQFHQDGTGKMPKRLLMDLDDQRLSEIGLIITQSLSERILGAIL